MSKGLTMVDRKAERLRAYVAIAAIAGIGQCRARTPPRQWRRARGHRDVTLGCDSDMAMWPEPHGWWLVRRQGRRDSYHPEAAA